MALALLNALVIVENKFGVSDDLDERSVLSLDGVGRGECFLPRASFVSRLSEPEPDFIARCAVRCKWDKSYFTVGNLFQYEQY